jgi:hypothetical protein
VFPTAVHADLEVHETAPRKYPGLCEVGDPWLLHFVPFHCSAIVPTLLPELSNQPPTAVHAFAEVHDTPVGRPPAASASVGIGWRLHLFPSHLSAPIAPPVLFPTAVHALGEVQETAFKNQPGLFEVGVGWMLQRVPFQRSVSVPTELPELSTEMPTATHADGDVHDTPSRPLPAAPARLGVGTMRHDVPSQNWARVPSGMPWRSAAWPTATQLRDDLHDTPRSCVPRTPSGLTVGSELHCVASHACPWVMTVPFASNPSPTAMQEDARGQATPVSALPRTAFEVGCRLQFWPFHRSATVENVLELSTLSPTAVQAEADEHETLLSWANCDPAGFAVGCTVQFVPSHCSASVTNVPEVST